MFKCDECGEEFLYKGSLTRHLKNIHKTTKKRKTREVSSPVTEESNKKQKIETPTLGMVMGKEIAALQ